MVELWHLEWTSLSEIREKANTYFKHSDLRSSQLRPNITSSLSSPSVPPAHNQRPPTKPEADKPCRQWNYYRSCSCDKANLESFYAFHKCRVCAKDHRMLHCPKRRNPIPPPNSQFLRKAISPLYLPPGRQSTINNLYLLLFNILLRHNMAFQTPLALEYRYWPLWTFPLGNLNY